MIYALYFGLPLAAGLGLFAVIQYLMKMPGRAMRSRFVSFGPLAGRTRGEIIAAVGQPNAVSALTGGKTLCQWMAAGYHIVLRFDGELCEGVTHEVSV